MKSFFFTTLSAGVLALAALGLAGTAEAAPSGPGSVDATVSQLRSEGYQVREPRRDYSARPLHRQRGPARPGVLAHRLRRARRPR